MTAPSPEPTLEEIRRQAITALIDLKGQSVMDLLFHYAAWAGSQSQPIRIDYGNLSGWLRGNSRRLSEQKQLAFAAFLGLREDQLQKGVVHTWQPKLGAFVLRKHQATIQHWFEGQTIKLWDVGQRPEQQQIIRIAQTNEHLLRIAATDSVWAWLMAAMGVADTEVRHLPEENRFNQSRIDEPLDYGEAQATLISIDRYQQIHNSAHQPNEDAWQQLIHECEQAGISPDKARRLIFKTPRSSDQELI